MKIVIIGGTGLIGSQLVSQLQNGGHDVIAASPSTGVNTLTGEGLNEAFKDTNVVIDVSNSPSLEDNAVMDFFTKSNENILAAEQKAGVQHQIALSVVGTQKLQASGYFRAKQVQENMIQQSGIPYTIVHATQFFEFAASIVHMSADGTGKVLVPDANIQPIASKDVVAFMAQCAVAAPANKIMEIGGPQKFEMKKWLKMYATATNKTIEIIADENALYSGAPIERETLNPEAAVYLGATNYEDWIALPQNQR